MRRALALLTIVAAGCGLPPGARDDAAPAASDLWSYDVAVADDLSHIDVKLSFRGAPPPRLILGDARGLTSLAAPVASWGSSALTLPRDGDAFATAGVGDDATISYRVDVERLTESGAATRVGGSVCASPGLWLLRARLLPDEPVASLVLHLPEHAQATTSWTRRADGAWLLDESTFRWRGFAAFGRIETHTIDAAGAALDVAILDRPHAATWPGIERWIAAAARAQASLYDGFPVPHAQIVVKPVSSYQAVSFGETQRGGGPAVILYLGDEAEDADLSDDWVAVHEFAHLGMPAMPEADAWLSEGFVTYYQVLLMARGGLLDERRAWQDLVSGFARGRRAHRGGTLAEESAAMNRKHAYYPVYWGGAAIALFLDVEIRRASGGARSLDDAIREIHGHFTARAVEVGAADMIAHLDAWLGRPLFSEISQRLLASSSFPATAEALAALGVVVKDGRVTGFDDTAPDAAVRRGIVPPPPR